jgi:hypothetical protein
LCPHPQLEIACGKETELLSVIEAEKCEYVARVTTPALCWPAKEAEGAPAASGGKQEL